jgi:aspartate/methionine/tyrosine aminotransferase
MASTRSAVSPFYVMQIFGAAEQRRATGLPVYNLAVGQPSTSAPSAVIAAARTALDFDKIGYSATSGLPPLREAIAAHTRSWYDIDVSAENVVVTTGASGGFLMAFLAAFDVGDVIAMPRPGYPAYRNILAGLGCIVQEFDCGPDDGFVPSLAMLDSLDPVPSGLILASPANPTGALVPAGRLSEIVKWCDSRGVRLISDELYHGITYGEPGATAWQFSRSPLVANSFSKYFSMTGWRLGWLLVPDELLDAVGRLAANYSICPPVLSQLAAISAFDAYIELDKNVERYGRNRAVLLDALPAIGLSRLAPANGAFYIYADVSDYTDDSLSWVRTVLDQTGVALAPGLDFDVVHGAKFARVSFAGDTDEIEQAVTVLGKFLAK